MEAIRTASGVIPVGPSHEVWVRRDEPAAAVLVKLKTHRGVREYTFASKRSPIFHPLGERTKKQRPAEIAYQVVEKELGRPRNISRLDMISE